MENLNGKALVFVLLCLLNQTFSQEANTVTESKSKWNFSVAYLPGASYRNLTGDQSLEILIDARNDLEKTTFTNGVGLNAKFNISDKWSLQSGLQYQIYGEQIKREFLTFGDMIDPVTGFQYPTSEQYIGATYIYNYHYLVMPIRVGYILLDKSRNQLAISTGVGLNIPVKETLKRKLNKFGGGQDKKVDKLELANKDIKVSASIGLDWSISVTKKLKVVVGPSFDIFLQSIWGNEPLKKMPYKIGFNIGVQI